MTADNTPIFRTHNAGMNLNEISTPELRRILRATERAAGPDSTEARIFRRELAKRGQQTRQQAKQIKLRCGRLDEEADQ